MKGVVFTEFLEMVEEKFSPEIADAIIDASDLPSGGAYTTIGTYDHGELLQLVTHLSEEVGVPVPDLVHTFGKHLFGRFHTMYPQLFEGAGDAFSFLTKIEAVIHVEVKKLYPDAELPTFEYERPDDATLVMTYRSKRPFADLAAGLIAGCVDHYGDPVEVSRSTLAGDRPAMRFTLTRT